MILIFSQNFEETTNLVFDYLKRNSDIRVLKMNTQDLVDEKIRFSPNDDFFHFHDEQIQYADIRVVWFRKWFDYQNIMTPFENIKQKDELFHRGLRSFLIEELNVLFHFLVYKLEHCFWLSRPKDNDINKLKVLSEAQKVGLTIPKTVITNRKEHITDSSLITKSMGDASEYLFEQQEFTFYTERIEKDELSQSFYPSLFQSEIQKDFEIRAFYLDDEIFSVAIFSQKNEQTSVDFRHYDKKKPNFNTEYVLPEYLKEQIKQLMNNLKLVTGSLDLIYSKNKEYVFLEINPIGQFGSVSDSANFDLEQRVANLLLQKHG